MTEQERMVLTARAGEWLAGQKWGLVRDERRSGDGRRLLHVALAYEEKQVPRWLLVPCVAFLYAGGNEPVEAEVAAEGTVFPGPWKLRRAWWERREDESEGNNRLELHRVYARAGVGDAERFLSENNCTYRVLLRFVFAAAAVEEAPAGWSGVTHAIRSANRDEETGLWDYIVETRERITTTTGEVEIECDAFKEVRQQSFHGVREGNRDHNGAAVPLWPVHNQPQGTLTEDVFIQKNDDCTVDIVQRRTVAKAAEARVERERTAFGETLRVTLRNQRQQVAASVAVADGKVVSRQSERNADGTFDNTQTERTALPGSGAAEYFRTAFQQGATVTARNQPAPVAAFVDVAGGVITRQSARRNDDGTWDNTLTLTTAVEASNAAVEKHETAFQLGVTVTHRNQPSPVAAFVGVAGGIVTRQSARQNEDGTWDNTEAVTTALEGSGAAEAYGTLYERGAVITLRNQAEPAAAGAAAAGGVITRVSARRNDDGTWDNTLTQTTELPVAAAAVEKRRTAFGVETVTVHRHQASPAPDPAAAGRTVRNEKTPGGLYDQTLTVEEAETGGGPGVEERHTLRAAATETLAEVVLRNAEPPPPEGHGHVPAAQTPGTVVTRTAVKLGNGKLETTDRTETAVRRAYSFFVPDKDGTYAVTRYFNFTAEEEEALLAALPGGGRNAVSPGNVNRFGLFDGVAVSRPVPDGDGSAPQQYGINGKTWTDTDLLQRGGVTVVRRTRYTYNVKQDWGLDSGYSLYDGALTGSLFEKLGNGDWYHFRKVTKIEVSETEVSLGGGWTTVAD